MSDSPAPISYINDENETSNNPSIAEEKQNICNYNDYPENIETTTDNNNTNPKPNSSVRITYRSKFNWFPFPFIYPFSGFGILGFYLFLKDGNIGEIGGVKFKLKGAVKAKSNIFFVPSNNYKEAISYKKKKHYNIEIVKVNTINDAINYLKNIK